MMMMKLVERRCLVFRGGCAGSTRLSGASLGCYTRGGHSASSRRYGVVLRCERPGDGSEQGKTDDSVESLFAKELKKRSINSPNDIQVSVPASFNKLLFSPSIRLSFFLRCPSRLTLLLFYDFPFDD